MADFSGDLMRDSARQRGWQFLMLFVFLGICLGAGAAGAALTAVSVGDWYQTLEKPEWTPPDRVFGPVWTTLFVLMALAAWLVWRREVPPRRTALALFAVQLALNIAWSGLFFTLRSPGLAFAEILLLWCAIASTLWAFWRISRPAGLLLTPYLLWVSYAAALNLAIWRING